MRSLRVGSRGSDLALWQTEFIRQRLALTSPDTRVEVVIIETKGDRVLDRPLPQVGGAGLFIKEIEQALLDERIDFAVHSAKDVPSEVPEGLSLVAFTERDDPRDALIARNAKSLSELPPGATLLTGSLRRRSQALALRPDLRIEDLRGNVPTRLGRFEASSADGMILASAGLKRLSLEDRIAAAIPVTTMIPAVGQGALALEAREDDGFVQNRIARLEDRDTSRAVRAERGFLKRLQGGCQVPLAAHGRLKDGRLHLAGFVGTIDGGRTLSRELTSDPDAGEALGVELAERMLDAGARTILAQYAENPRGSEDRSPVGPNGPRGPAKVE